MPKVTWKLVLSTQNRRGWENEMFVPEAEGPKETRSSPRGRASR